MQAVRDRVENWFGVFAGTIYLHPKLTLFISFLFVAALFSNLPKVTVDTSIEGFLHEDDPAMITYNRFKEDFGRDDLVVVALKPESVYSIAFLEKLRNLQKELEQKVPYLDEVTSLVNARETVGRGDELIVGDLLDPFPKTDADIADLKKRIEANQIYKNLMISEDGTFTTLVIKLLPYVVETGDNALEGFDDEPLTDSEVTQPRKLSDAENTEALRVIRETVNEYKGADLEIYVAGSPATVDQLGRAMLSDMRKFALGSLAVITILLFLLFRRASGVLLPLMIIILSVVSTVSLMAMFGTPLKLPTQIVPSFLLAVSVGDSVHILSIFYYRLHLGDDKQKAIIYAIEHSGLAVLMTSLTTAAGLGSFAVAKIAPIADLGIYASSGVMLALLYTIVLLPVMISLFPIGDKVKEHHSLMAHRFDAILLWFARFSVDRAKSIVVVSVLIAIGAIYITSGLRFSHNPLKWMPEDMEGRVATEMVDKHMRGTTSLEVIIDTKKENGFYDPVLLHKIDSLKQEIEQIDRETIFVGKVITITDILKEINRALNENKESAYTIPDNKELIAQEFLLFENSGSDDLEDFVDSKFSRARFTIKTPWVDSIEYSDFVVEIKNMIENKIGDSAQITVTGVIVLLSRTLSAAIVSAAESYIIAILVISIMMIFMIGDIRLGLYSMFPNILPILIMLAVMGIFNLPLDMFTMLIGSIAIGLAVDDTVHFMHNYRRYHDRGADPPQAIRETLLTAGRAMFTTSIVLSIGFFIFMLADMHNLFNFGLLTGITIVSALLADFLLAPALMSLLHKSEELQ
jgi:predicted RND superfamily exporter protein